MPVRFSDISPYDFEDLMVRMMRDAGYSVEQTPYSGDFGADLVVEKGKERTVVQVKRYDMTRLVGVSDINQVLGAMQYYEADNGLVITTSGFSPAAIELARSTPLMLWDWSRLQDFISREYFDGEDYFAYFKEELQMGGEAKERFRLHFQKLDEDAELNGKPVLAMEIGLENCSDENIFIHLDRPMIITQSGKQVTSIAWDEELFQFGLLVSGATCDIGFSFPRSRLTEVKPGDRLLLRMNIKGEDQPVYLDEKLGVPKSACYVATFLYGKDSPEYGTLTAFRDHFLMRSPGGRGVVVLYYQISPRIVQLMSRGGPGCKLVKMLIRMLSDQCVKCVTRYYPGAAKIS